MFSVLVVHHRDDIVLQLTGTLDGGERDALRDCVAASLAEAPRQLVLELSSIESVDGEGAAALRAGAILARDADIEFVLDGVPSFVRDELEGCPARFR